MNKNIEQIASEQIEPKKTLAELENNLTFVKKFLDSAIKIGNTRSTIDFCASLYRNALNEYEQARYGQVVTDERELQKFIQHLYEIYAPSIHSEVKSK
jgi:hypothetical protein